MNAFEQALILLLLVTVLSVVARWLPWPGPITFALGGALIALVPSFPKVALDPELFFLVFLPPLLFADGWLMPLRELAKTRRPVILLATGLVLFTTLVVGFVAPHIIPGLPRPMAFALGAVISPTDAVAIGAIAGKIRLPTRLATILDGESLLNDATGLVGFRFALAALSAGTLSLGEAARQFVLLAVGGLAFGYFTALGVGRLRDALIRIRAVDAMIEITLSLLTPYAAYLGAEALHVSGILAAAAAGLYSGWRDPVRMDPETRQVTWSVWRTVLFWLNGVAFVLLGLQFPRLVDSVANRYSAARLVFSVVAISVVAIVLRIAWFFPGAYLPFLMSRRVKETEEKPSWRDVLVGGWAGMRGTVTLAAALSIPLILPDGRPVPGREIVIFIAFGVIAVTLLVQGTTLEWVIRKLGIRGDGTVEREELLARAAAVAAGLRTLRGFQVQDLSAEQAAALARVVAEYEARTSDLAEEGESRDNARERLAAEWRFRIAALDAERRELDELWTHNVIMDEVHRPLQRLLDHEESMLRHPSAPGRPE